MFYRYESNEEHSRPRIEQIRQAIRDAGASYGDTASIEVYDAQRIADWCNEYLSAVAYVSERVGLVLPVGLKTWHTWAKDPKHQFPYFSNSILDAFSTQIRDAASQAREVVRIEGYSGLGKTRLILETFRAPTNDKDRVAVRDSLVYADAALFERELPGFVADLCNRKIQGLLIIDNCSGSLHTQLTSEVRRSDSNLRLVTIDYEISRPGYLRCSIVRLEPRHLVDVVNNLLKQAFPELKQVDLGRIALFAQGFPRIAVLLAEARKQGDSNLGALNDEELLEKLLWGRDVHEEKARKVIESCAIFDVLGLAGEAASQRNFVAEEICEMTGEEFYGICQKFIDRGVCQTGGDYIQVTPKPLALRLAAEWWRKRPPESVPPLLAKIANNRLGQALCDQMAKLDFLPQARELTKQLCGDRGPFGNAEVLSSDEGSRLFRSLVEVNPLAGAQALYKAFGARTTEELKSVAGTVRRNLIWALEKMCFWADIFPVAAPVLLAFAAAENETWANNATGLYLQLFHILLPGTKASLTQRMQAAQDALGSPHIEKRRLGIKALGSALHTGHFSRMGGAETQGSRAPEEDYQPTRTQIGDYWRKAIQLLVSTGEAEGELSVLAQEQLAGEIRGLLTFGIVEETTSAVSKISAKRGPWPEARAAINDALEFEGSRFTAEMRERLKDLAESLQPVALVDRLRLQISTPEWEHQKRDDGSFLDVSEMRAEALADELAVRGPDWFEHLPLILDGEQRQGFAFGRRLSMRITDPRPFVEAAISGLRVIPKERRNCSVLAGFLNGVTDRHVVTAVLERIERDPGLNEEIVELTRLTKPTKEDLARLVSLLQRSVIAVERFRSFAYNSVLNHLQAPEIIQFCRSLGDFNSTGVICGFHILFMYCLHNNERWAACKATFRSLLCRQGVIDDIHKDTMLAHAWQETMAKLLTSEPKDNELALWVVHEVVRSAATEHFSYSADHYITPMLTVLLSRYFESAWPVLGAALISKDWMTTHHLSNVLGDLNDKSVGASLIAALPVEFLRDWCGQNRPNAARVLARITPIFVRTESSMRWHPVARMLLDNFGEDKEMLSELSANWGTFSWSGSLIPYYEQQLALIQPLADHLLPSVREWQAQNAQWVQQRIAVERKREEEERLGVR